MKCPYCNYVSFEYLDSCRKCSKDLTAHKSQYGIDFLEPVSLGVLAFTSGAAMAAEAAEDVTATFDTGDFSFAADTSEGVVIGGEAGETGEGLRFGGEEEAGIAIGEAPEEPAISIGETDSELSLVLGESEEITIPGFEEEEKAGEGIELSLGEEAEGIEEVASNSGFSLNIGEDFETDTGIGLEEPPTLPELEEEAGEEISLESIDLGDIEIEEEPAARAVEAEELEIEMAEEPGEEGGIEISLEEEEKAPEISMEEEPGEISLEDIGTDADIELALDLEEEEEPTPDMTVKLSEEEIKKASREEGEEGFADIELSTDEEELFKDDDAEIDLGDLDLQIGDDDLEIEFD